MARQTETTRCRLSLDGRKTFDTNPTSLELLMGNAGSHLQQNKPNLLHCLYNEPTADKLSCCSLYLQETSQRSLVYQKQLFVYAQESRVLNDRQVSVGVS
jgi:hypothetical protein